jgi:hypothetical protein
MKKYLNGANNMEKLKCLRCQHEWFPKVATPSVCPKCKSGYWNKPYRIKEPLHPDEKPQEIIEQYIEEQNPDTIEKLDTPKEIPDINVVMLKCMESIMKTLERIENKPTQTIPQPEQTFTREQSNESLLCAREHMFICNGENKSICTICKQQEFWKNAKNLRIALELEDIEQPGETVSEDNFETKAMSCKERTTNAGVPFCVYKYKGELHNNYCGMCWELEQIWGRQAAGYMERRSKKGVNSVQ